MPTPRKPRVETEPPPAVLLGPLHPTVQRGHGPRQPVKCPPFGADRLREVLGASTDVPGASTDVPVEELCETAALELERLREQVQRADHQPSVV